MIPLCLGSIGEKYKIRKISGSGRVRLHLEELGFVVGAFVTIISACGGNLIVAIKDSRVALGEAMAQQILISN